MKTKKKYIIISAAILLIFAAVLLSFNFNKVALLIVPRLMETDVSSLTQDQNKTLDSLRKVDDHPLYVMEYYGDHQSKYLELKKKYYWYMGIPKPKCSTFSIKNQNGDAFFGRNNDNLDCPVLLIFTHPKNGYASVSVADIGDAFGFDTGNKSPLNSREAATRLLYAPYAISDGMNEWGLTIGTMSVHTASKVVVDPNKETMNNSEMRRYILDHAKNTDEAIEILSKYNIHFPGELEHLLISDPSGNSVVVEWPEGHMQVVRSKEPWMAATNFMIYGAGDQINAFQYEYDTTGKISGDTPGKNYWRYITLKESLGKMAGEEMNAGDAMNLLRKVSLVRTKEMDWPTQWSVVYDMNSGEINIAMGRNYDNIHNFKLEMKK